MDKDLTRSFVSHNRERGPMWVISLSTCPTRKKTPRGRAYGRPAVRLALRAILTYPGDNEPSSRGPCRSWRRRRPRRHQASTIRRPSDSYRSLQWHSRRRRTGLPYRRRRSHRFFRRIQQGGQKNRRHRWHLFNNIQLETLFFSSKTNLKKDDSVFETDCPTGSPTNLLTSPGKTSLPRDFKLLTKSSFRNDFTDSLLYSL